jgi:FixJ family two-component response regulator
MKPVISIIDDDASVREGTMDLLKSMGFIADAFESGSEFLNSTRLQNSSCLIVDVQMPGMTGLELHDYLVNSGRVIPTILITAFPNTRDKVHARRAGVDCYLTKPFNAGELLTCIRKVLDTDRSES